MEIVKFPLSLVLSVIINHYFNLIQYIEETPTLGFEGSNGRVEKGKELDDFERNL